MLAKIKLKIDKGLMPRSGWLNKPLNIVLDNRIVRAIGWGDKTVLEIPAGKHVLSVMIKRSDKASNAISIDAGDMETVNIGCYLDTENKKLTLVNEADIASADALKNQVRRMNAYISSYGTIYFIGGAAIVLGLVSVYFKVNYYGLENYGFSLIIVGLIFLVLGFFVKRKSNIALTLAIAIYGLDGFVFGLLGFTALRSLISQGNSLIGLFSVLLFSPFYVGYLFAHIIFIIPMTKGISAIKALTKYETKSKTNQIPAQKFCSSCGNKLSNQPKFCAACGTSVQKEKNE